MNKIQFKLERVTDFPMVRDAISFSNIAFINPVVDGKSIFEDQDFKDSFMVYDELIKSSNASGKYLLFTCACGVADDGGWNGVDVMINTTTLNWQMDRNPRIINFTFDTAQFNFELRKLTSEINNLNDKLALEPTHIDFPEEW